MWFVPGLEYDLLGGPGQRIIDVSVSGHIGGVVISSAESRISDIDEFTTAIQTLVRIWYTKSSVRGIVPWKRHVEHAIENTVRYVANVADRDLIVKTLHRFWFPQRKPVEQ